MAVTHVWDSNIAIYLLDGELTPSAEQVLQKLLDEGPAGISVISELEILGFKGMTPAKITQAKQFISAMWLFGLEEPIKEITVELRRQLKIKLPDAIIAATALANGAVLVTRNTKDFRNIPNLLLVDPFVE